MDNVFSEIKSRLAMPEVARFYGLEVNRAGMACCPFHDDKSPSLKVYDDHFYCFGGAKQTSSPLQRATARGS
ncbi:MAG: hypothetical protein K2N06_05920 [Oscillospiraceae bacterium]|nr:hypothetical protein [Oscillospiraceae bacterium]